MKTVAEKCLKNIELVLQYIDNQEKRESIAKDYDQQISEARRTRQQFSLNMTDTEIINEFKRVSDIMANNLKASYMVPYRAQVKEYDDVIKQLEVHIRETNDFIASYQSASSQLEAKFPLWDKVWKCCTGRISQSDLAVIREKCGKTDGNPFSMNITFWFSKLKENIKEIPEEYISIHVGTRTITADKFLNEYTPTYIEQKERGYYHEFLDIEITPPTGVKGIFSGYIKNLMPSIKQQTEYYNAEFEKFCIAKSYIEIFIQGKYEKSRRDLQSYKQSLAKYRRELPQHEKNLAEIKQIRKDYVDLNDLRKHIELGHIKPLSKAELEKVKAKTLTEAASKLKITQNDLGDYIALCSSKEDYNKFVAGYMQERAKIYIDSSIRKQSYISMLEAEKQNKIASIKIPNLEDVFRRWNEEYPLYAQMGFPQQMSEADVKKIMDSIVRTASTNYALNIYPNGDCFHIPGGKTSKGEFLWAPSFSMPDGRRNIAPNLMLAHDKATIAEAKQSLNRTLVNLLLAVPPRKLKLRIIDLGATNMASLITTRLHPSLYNNEVVMNDRELRSVVEEWQARTKRVMQKCENIADYNEQNQTWLEPYEVVVVLGYPQSISPNCEEMLRPFVENGAKSGLIFVFVTNTDIQMATNQTLIKEKGLFKTILPFIPRGRYYPLPHTPIADQNQLLDYAFEYLNSEAEKKEEKPIAVQDVRQLVEIPYQPDTASNIKVAVGDDNGRNVYFELDTLNHLHAFILGQSGTGKSRFLHNIIGNIMLAHSPQNVEFYLMDLKLGGVEFNVYKGEKHVKALLVDNNDRQITLEVLRDLSMRMEQRNKEFAEAGVRNLEAYNQKSGTPMPQIVLVVDECQMLFTERPDNTERELRDILSLIVKQGRSQGVHMILSTQTLMNSTIPIDVLQGAGLTDFYLLNCDPRDSEKLVKGSSAKTGTLQTGEIYYHHHQHSAPDAQFRAFYVDDEQQNAILEGAVQKSKDLDAPGQFYFSGKLQAHLSEEVISSMQRRSRRSLCASFGVGIDLKQQPVNISLPEEQGENVLIFGLNQRHQATRTATETFLSALYSARAAGRDTEFIVIDCLSSEDETPYQILFDSLEDQGLIRQVFGRQRGELLSKLGDSVRSHKANETLILILGQDRWRELRNDKELEVAQTGVEQKPAEGASFLGGLSFPSSRTQQRTYRSELQYLLENGAEDGVHFIVQVDKPQNLIGAQNVSQQMVKKLFRHWIMLRSAADASLSLRLRDDIRLENLSDDLDRLRAIYYCDDTDSYQLITPYRYTTEEENKNLINL